MTLPFITYFRESFGRNLLNEQIRSHASLFHGQILDVGSGSRRYDHLFNAQITAIDLQPDPTRNITYGDIHVLAFTGEHFDGVICFEVLCYSSNVRKALQELLRVTKPDGQILLSTPFLLRDSGDRVRFTKRYLEELLNELNVKNVHIIPCGNAWTIIWDILRTTILETRSKPMRLVLSLLFLPYLLLILALGLHRQKTPLYTAEHVVVITK
ncbi:class I SAM-dependent methyltransferase [Candidatus Uhrbacteria bacterium]|nr:class I SAM-dependent methyltransferase [Candidatus Uhrbacteria bacterium]